MEGYLHSLTDNHKFIKMSHTKIFKNENEIYKVRHMYIKTCFTDGIMNKTVSPVAGAKMVQLL